MKRIKFLLPAIVLFLSSNILRAQPIPIELMFGNDYGVFELAFSKSLAKDSRIGFFHLNSVEFGYDGNYSSIIVEDLLYIETFKHLNLAGGLAYTPGGFSPTVGLQYLISGPKFLFLCAPRVNIESDPAYDVMTIIQYKAPINEKLKLFTRAKFLNVFNTDGNLKSYQWFRLGLETKGIQFGLGVNLDERGPDPSLTTNWGVFIRKEIF